MFNLLIPIGLFTLIISLLSGAVLLARRQLTRSKTVKLIINRDRNLSVSSGETLLATLARENILLPAACAGRATCGQCRVIVNQADARLLPTETAHINHRDAVAGYRLACVLKVREDLELSLPPTVLEARQLRCRVLTNRNLSTYLTELTMEIPQDTSIQFRAGDYVLVEAPTGFISFADLKIDPSYRLEWERLNLLGYSVEITQPTTRAYSLANALDEKGVLVLVVRIAVPPVNAPPDTPPGKVSSYIYSLKPGDTVNVSGPFGDFHATENEREMVLVGGGAGIAPMRSIIRDQLLTKKVTRKIGFWYGSRNVNELVYNEEFNALAKQFDNFTYQVVISAPLLDSTWSGPTGFIHNYVYENYLKDHPAPEDVEYYLCGPPLMSSAMLTMLEDLGVDQDKVFLDDFGNPAKEG